MGNAERVTVGGRVTRWRRQVWRRPFLSCLYSKHVEMMLLAVAVAVAVAATTAAVLVLVLVHHDTIL